jgi:hypothetical protein
MNMRKELLHSAFVLVLVASFSFIQCKKAADNGPCEKTGETLLKARPSLLMPMPQTVYHHPRILGGKVWFYSNSVLNGIEIEGGTVNLIQHPIGFRLLNPNQSTQSYLGTDEASIFLFDPASETWETIYTAASTDFIDYGLDLYSDHGLLPFVEANKASLVQTIALFDLPGHQKRALPNLNSFQSQNPFRILAQPKVFVRIGPGNSPDTVLTTLVRFSSKSTSSLLVYSLTHQSVKANASLDGLSYGDALKIGDHFALTTTGSLYSQSMILFNPFTAEEIWRKNAGGWIQKDGDLFRIVDGILGGLEKTNLQNGARMFTLPYDVDPYSAFAMQDNYGFLGRETPDAIEGLRNHLVLINQEGCEIFREKLPFSVSLGYQGSSLIYSPDRKEVLSMDEEKNLHFFKLE